MFWLVLTRPKCQEMFGTRACHTTRPRFHQRLSGSTLHCSPAHALPWQARFQGWSPPPPPTRERSLRASSNVLTWLRALQPSLTPGSVGRSRVALTDREKYRGKWWFRSRCARRWSATSGRTLRSRCRPITAWARGSSACSTRSTPSRGASSNRARSSVHLLRVGKLHLRSCYINKC